MSPARLTARRAGVRLLGFAAMAIVAAAPAAELPNGFGSIRIGDRWTEPADRSNVRRLADLTLPWDRYVNECGYRRLQVDLESGELLVTVNDFVVTELSYVTPIKRGSDILAIAALIMKSYGQPVSAAMRDLAGRVTIDRDRANFITLRYHASNPVEFAVSGRELWRYQVTVRFGQRRWHENKTYRCAREKETSAPAARPPDPRPAAR